MTMSRLIRGHNVQTHNNSLANLVRGVGERVLFTNRHLDLPILPAVGAFRKLESYRETIVSRLGRQSPVARDEFPSFYKGPRKALYERAVQSLVVKPSCPKDSMLRTFVKAEKCNLDVKADPVPRVIQPRDPRYNVEVGRYLRPIEHKIYDEIDNLFGSPTVMSPYNAYEQAKHIEDKWNSFQVPVCVGLDASRFDQHVSRDALEFEHSIYNKLFKSRELRSLLQQQIFNWGVAHASDGSFTYKKVGSRMSGDMNTSLGNKIIMCLMSKYYVDSKTVRIDFVNNGDDCLMILEKRDLSVLRDLKDFYVQFGFNIVTEKPVYELERVEFCQTSPIRVNGILRMVRNARTCMSKDVTSLTLGHDVNRYQSLLADIGKCGLATASDVPILGSFYRMLQRLGTESKEDHSDRGYSFYYRSSRNATCKYNVPDPAGRLSYFISTGITPEEQTAIEEYFDAGVWGDHKQRQLFYHINEILQ